MAVSYWRALMKYNKQSKYNTESWIEYLKYRNLIDYGIIIDKETLETIFKRKYVFKEWDWLNFLFRLQRAIEEEGFITVTKQAYDDSHIKILPAEEMFIHMKRYRDNYIRNVTRKMDNMNTADISILDDGEKAKHKLMQDTIALDLMSMKSILSKYKE